MWLVLQVGKVLDNFDQMMGLEEMWGDHQSQYDSSCGDHERLYKISQ